MRRRSRLAEREPATRGKLPDFAAAGIMSLLLLASGCVVPVHQQGLVSKPNMLFSDSAAFAYHAKSQLQVETGAATTGGAVATGCTSCR